MGKTKISVNTHDSQSNLLYFFPVKVRVMKIRIEETIQVVSCYFSEYPTESPVLNGCETDSQVYLLKSLFANENRLLSFVCLLYVPLHC